MLIGKALRRVETDLAAPVSLTAIADMFGVSQFHLARSFAAVEYYPPEFNGMTGDGGFEIWVPVKG